MLELGNIFTDGTMPAVAALPGTGKRGPGHFFFLNFFFAAEYSGTRNRTRVVVNRAGTRLPVAALMAASSR